jgi:hypothetical protein
MDGSEKLNENKIANKLDGKQKDAMSEEKF